MHGWLSADKYSASQAGEMSVAAERHGPTTLRWAYHSGNKLRGGEYDDTSWSARTWMGYTAQRVSCALARAVAWELATAMSLTRLRDARDD